VSATMNRTLRSFGGEYKDVLAVGTSMRVFSRIGITVGVPKNHTRIDSAMIYIGVPALPTARNTGFALNRAGKGQAQS
jgi:hypothetical protein